MQPRPHDEDVTTSPPHLPPPPSPVTFFGYEGTRYYVYTYDVPVHVPVPVAVAVHVPVPVPEPVPVRMSITMPGIKKVDITYAHDLYQ